MIFAIWYVAWLATADSILQLLLPGLALVVRSSYMDQSVPIPRLAWIALWLIIAGFSALIPDKGIPYAIVFFLKLALSALLIFHLMSTMKRSRLRKIVGINQVWFFMTRSLLILRKRAEDIALWRRIRIARLESKRRNGNFVDSIWHWILRLPKILSIYKQSTLAFLVEVLVVRKRLETVVEARGGFPDNSDWMQGIDSRGAWRFTAMADIIIVLAMLAPVSLGGDSLVPTFFLKGIEAIHSFSSLIPLPRARHNDLTR